MSDMWTKESVNDLASWFCVEINKYDRETEMRSMLVKCQALCHDYEALREDFIKATQHVARCAEVK